MKKIKSNIEFKGKFDVPNTCLLKKDGRRIIAGYASIAEVDVEGDLISLDALKSGLEVLINDERYANIMLSHTDIQIGHLIKEYNGLTTHVDDKGLFIIAELRKGFRYADDIWEEILLGNVNGFSIGGYVEEGSEKQVCEGNTCWNEIVDISLFEVSVCEYPANQKSGFVVLNKHKDFEDNVDKKNVGDKMPKEKETTEEIKEEEPEEEVNPLDELNMGFESLSKDVSGVIRRLEALEKIIQDIMKPKEEEPLEESTEEKSENKSEDKLEEDTLEEPEVEKSEELEEECEDCKASDENKSTEKSVPEPEVEKSEEEVTEVEKTEEPVEEIEEVVKEEEKSESDEKLEVIEKSIEDRDDLIKSMEKKISELESKIKELEEQEQPKKTMVDKPKKDFSKCEKEQIVVKNGEVYYKEY